MKSVRCSWRASKPLSRASPLTSRTTSRLLRRTACIPTICARRATWPAFHLPSRPICEPTIRLGYSPCPANKLCACTTGKPTVVGYTAQDIDTWANLMARSLHAAGARAGDIAHVAYGYGLFTGGLGAHYGAERLGCSVVPMSGGQTEKQIQLITDFRPDLILVTPSYMLTLIDAMAQAGIDPRQTSLQLGVFGAEPWTEAMRREIETRTDMDAIDIFGLSEIMGPGVACECIETKDGAVIWEDHFYPEIIDPVSGEVLPDGELGELVITTLTKQALPLIRYRTRDLTRLLPPTARNMRRIDKITGRSDDMLIIRGVNLFPTQIEEIVCAIPGLSPHYVIHVDKDGHLDRLLIEVELRDDSAAPRRAELAREVAHKAKTLIGVSALIEVRDPFALERVTLGKARRVFDRRVQD